MNHTPRLRKRNGCKSGTSAGTQNLAINSADIWQLLQRNKNRLGAQFGQEGEACLTNSTTDGMNRKYDVTKKQVVTGNMCRKKSEFRQL